MEQGTEEAGGRQLLYTVRDACIALGGISQASLYRWIAAGDVETVQLGRRRMVKADSIARIAQHGTRAA
jgi:predicted site-specific integrase-resolvase